MLTFAELSRVAILGAATLAVAPSYAASTATDAYVANARSDTDFLAASSKIAAGNTGNEAIKAFAAAEAEHQAGVRANLDDWLALEQKAKSVRVAAADDLQSGRSVANPTIDMSFTAPDGVGVMMPASLVSLDKLSAMKDGDFDATYKAVQVNALKHLEGFYDAYSQTGDDVTLRQLAGRELTDVRERLAAAEKL